MISKLQEYIKSGGIIVQENCIKLYGDIGIIENGVYTKK
jgi:hypothetical protein